MLPFVYDVVVVIELVLLDTPIYVLLYFPTLLDTALGTDIVPLDTDVFAAASLVHLTYVVSVAELVVLEAVKLPLVVLLL